MRSESKNRPRVVVARAWPSDRALVDQILSGSQRHFALLYTHYFPPVYRFALRRLRDSSEAEDVAQDVFLTAMTALGSFKGHSSLLAWLFGVTRNKLQRRFRRPDWRLKSLEEIAGLEFESDRPRCDEIVDARRVLRRCKEVVAHRLTPLQRRVFELKHLDEQSISAIADVLGTSEDAIKSSLYRMRRRVFAGVSDLEIILRG
ncbi:MAG: RNA polymerase sigma factor [Myxococcota bacterium]